MSRLIWIYAVLQKPTFFFCGSERVKDNNTVTHYYTDPNIK